MTNQPDDQAALKKAWTKYNAARLNAPPDRNEDYHFANGFEAGYDACREHLAKEIAELRTQIDAMLCNNEHGYKHLLEETIRLIEERDQLRAEVERLKAMYEPPEEPPMTPEEAAAFEAELKTITETPQFKADIAELASHLKTKRDRAKENDTLKAKLAVAVEALKRISDGKGCCGDTMKCLCDSVAFEALKQIGGEGE